MYRYEQALCGSDKLQHAPALGEHALTLHVQLVTTILTVRGDVRQHKGTCRSCNIRMRRDKDAF